MELDVVRQPLLAAFATLLLLAVATMIGVDSPGFVTPEPTSLLGGYITQIQVAWPLLTKLFCVLLLFASGASLGYMTIRCDLYPAHTFLTIPLYGMFTCGLPVSSDYTVQYLSAALFIFAMNNLCVCFRNGSYGFGPIFRGAFLLGLIPLIYTPAAVLLIIVPLAVVAFKHSIRELIVAAVGCILPFFWVCYLNWAVGGSFMIPFEALYESFFTPLGFSIIHAKPLSQIMPGVMLLLFFCAAFCYYRYMYSSGSRSRSILQLSLLLFLIAGALFFLPCASPALSAFLAAPAAVVLPLLLLHLRRWAASSIYLLLIALCALRFIP